MESKAEFKEGIESNRRRIITELGYMNSNIDAFVDVRNMKFELRHLVQSYRRSLEKCNMYLSTIEDLIEKNGDDTKNDTDLNKNVERTSVSGREDII